MSASSFRRLVLRGGMPSRGLDGAEVGFGMVEGRSLSLSREDMVASEDIVRRGGRVCEDEASRRGVDVVEFSVEGGRTRLLRRKVKNAVWVMVSCLLFLFLEIQNG